MTICGISPTHPRDRIETSRTVALMTPNASMMRREGIMATDHRREPTIALLGRIMGAWTWIGTRKGSPKRGIPSYGQLVG
jgi:hypothetical protein